jgi:hypothetical protein
MALSTVIVVSNGGSSAIAIVVDGLNWKCQHFQCLQRVNFEDISLCRPDVSAQHGQHFANMATFGVSFSCHILCCVSLITDMLVSMVS